VHGAVREVWYSDLWDGAWPWVKLACPLGRVLFFYYKRAKNWAIWANPL
jgi:hypothetical protein